MSSRWLWGALNPLSSGYKWHFAQASSWPLTSSQCWGQENVDLYIYSPIRFYTHFCKTETTRNHPHQNVLVTRTQIKLSTSNKLIYKTILKPIWTYGIQLWGTVSTSDIEIVERFQSKALGMIVDAPWYVPNTVIQRDLQTPTVKEEIRCYSSQYSARLSAHPNDLIVNLTELPDNRWLQRHLSNDLPTRFLV
jgi:hypothetical protein